MEYQEPQTDVTPYNPSAEVQMDIAKLYGIVDSLHELRNQQFPEFNDRTLRQYLDDNDKRLNCYVVPRTGKDAWRANVAFPTVRDKLKRTISGFSLEVPEMDMTCYGQSGVSDVDGVLDGIDRAGIAKWVVRSSYAQEENSVMENYKRVWECARAGTVIDYEGYLKARVKQYDVTDYDPLTGKVEKEEYEVDAVDKCVSTIVPLTEFYVGNLYEPEIQSQNRVAWVRYYDKATFEFEFGKLPDAKAVKTGGECSHYDTESFFYSQSWRKRCKDEKQIEVVRLWMKDCDRHVILANGILLLDVPFLLKSNGVKVFPFAVARWEIFANTSFFYGNSFVNIIAPQAELFDTTLNTGSDKQFRAMTPRMMVGRENLDALDTYTEEPTDQETIVHVPDVNQVKIEPIDGITAGELGFIQLQAKLIEDTAPSLPSVMNKRDVTAREFVRTDEHLQEMKQINYQAMVDLWKQKFCLRLANIQLNYPKARKVVEKGKEVMIYRTFEIKDTVLNTVTGEVGVLVIQFHTISDDDFLEIQAQISAEEELMAQQGVHMRKLLIPEDFLDNVRYQIEIVDAAVVKKSQGMQQAVALEKVQTKASLFPEIFLADIEGNYEDLCKAYGENPGPALKKYKEYKAQQQAMMGVGPVGEEGAPETGTEPQNTTPPAPVNE